MVACYYGYTDIARYLYEHGAGVNAKSETGDTALSFAFDYNFSRIVEVLLEHGVSVNMKDGYGHTALFYAERNQQTEIVKQLRAVGAVAE